MAQIIDMPKLSDTMTVGTLVKWKKKEGEPVKSGDMLAEVETDKATMELESFFDGLLLKIFAPEGSQVAVGSALCAIGKAGETVEAPASAQAPQKAPEPGQASPASAAAQAPAPVQAPVVTAPPAPLNEGRLRISPLAKKLARELAVDPRRVQGSGPGGRIVRADILAATKGAPSSQTATSSSTFTPASSPLSKGPIQEERVFPVSNMRGTIARRLLESKIQIPHFYLDLEIDAGPLTLLRQQLNSSLEKEGIKLSVNDFILKACAEALRRVPSVNASWENTQIRYFAAAHVSFAVAMDDGLITPVIRDAHAKSVLQISTEAKQLAKLAKDKKLQPAQFTGGTFCVSNLGMMGIDRFTAIINPPNAAILAVGATVRKPVVKDGVIQIGERMTLTLSCDHRVVDGALGAQFLAALRQVLEAPALLLL